MPETLETLAERLERLEATVQHLTIQLSPATEKPKPPQKRLKPPQTGAEVMAELAVDKRPLAEGFRKYLKRIGAPEKPTITLKALRERMVRNGIRPEDNEFSRAIIEAREE
jgi:hypothetical protein